MSVPAFYFVLVFSQSLLISILMIDYRNCRRQIKYIFSATRTHTNIKKKAGKGMENKDTIELLKECDAGPKMAVSSIDEVIDYVKDERFKSILKNTKSHHKKLESEIGRMLKKKGFEGKNPPAAASVMSWMKTNFKLMSDPTYTMVADLITDGCNMGIKSLNEYLNAYDGADKGAKDMCRQLISVEERLCDSIAVYL